MTNNNNNKGNNKPVFNVKIGQVQGAVFLNSNDDNTWFSTKVSKSYNNGSKKKPNYQNTDNYNNVDLADLSLVAIKCYEYVKTNYAEEHIQKDNI